jgi:hypothetical protein
MTSFKPQHTCVALGLAAAGTGALIAVRNRDTRTIARLRDTLERRDGSRADRFDPAMVSDLPKPARRYFLHTLRPGTPLAHSVRLDMSGEMRLGADQRWLPFRARQVLAPPDGFVWEASVGNGLLRFVGADSYTNGQGRMVFRLWDLVPIVRAGGPDVSRSARGRLAIESIWNPASLLPERGVMWTSLDDRSAQAIVAVDGEPIPLTLSIAPDGRLRSVVMERWGNSTADCEYALIPFGADILEETTFGGYTVPSRLCVRWWYGTSHAFEFFRARLTRMTYLRAGFATPT